jgi:non-heme chloroperoxidase
MSYLSVDDGTRVYYEDRGEGPTLLFVHGILMNQRIFERQTSVLADEYRVVSVDLRGHGRSDAPQDSYTVERYAADVAQLIDELEVSQLCYVGWSYGAIVGTKLLGEHDVDVERAVLASAGMFDRVANPDDQSLSFIDMEAFMTEYRTRRPEALERFLDALFRDEAGDPTRRWVHDIGMESALHAGDKSMQATGDVDFRQFRDYLDALEIPVRVFHGAEDVAATVDDARTLAEEILERGSLTVFEESGHFPFLAEPEEFNAELSAFVDGGENYSRS